MQGVIREDVWSNKGWYQCSEFKGKQSFGYESRPSTTTSDLLTEAPGGAAELLSSSFCLTLPDLFCLPSAQVHYIYLFHRCNSLHINCSFFPLRSIHSLSFPSIHGPNRAIDSSARHDCIVLECEDEKGSKRQSVLGH